MAKGLNVRRRFHLLLPAPSTAVASCGSAPDAARGLPEEKGLCALGCSPRGDRCSGWPVRRSLLMQSKRIACVRKGSVEINITQGLHTKGGISGNTGSDTIVNISTYCAI